DEVMPCGQRLTLTPQAIGAGAGEPAYRLHLLRCQAHAIRNEAAAILVAGALPAVPIEQAAGDIGGIDAAGILILRLVQAAFAASVAQRFPLRAVELIEGFFPEIQCLTSPIFRGTPEHDRARPHPRPAWPDRPPAPARSARRPDRRDRACGCARPDSRWRPS